MSTLRLTTISNQGGTASVPSDTVINGSAKAWVNFNGTGTVAIRASFNVSSITDNGTGDYTVNFTTALADANYSVSGINPFTIANGNVFQVYFAASTTGTVRVRTFNGLVSPASDADTVQLAIFR
jgi:hypothetical protein